MGAGNFQIIRKVLIPETLPSIIRGITISVIGIVGFTAMAGAIGAGGLGSLAIRYGYQRFRTDVLIGTVFVLLIIKSLIYLFCFSVLLRHHNFIFTRRLKQTYRI